MKNSFQNLRAKILGLPVILPLILGLIAGYAIRGARQVEPAGDAPRNEAAAPRASQVWTCSMHPQIKLPKPGQCPICFMDLIALKQDVGDVGPRELVMSEGAKALAEIETAEVVRKLVEAEIRFVGKVAYDETRLGTITAWVPGRIDRLFVDYTGIPVREGDHMVYLYSPELYTAQEELLLFSTPSLLRRLTAL